MPRIIGVNYQEVPIGTLAPFAGGNVPSGWLVCDGSAVSRTTYSKLFTAIRTTWGVGDLSTTFNIPDFRGRTMRFADGSAGLDPDKTVRTAQVAGTFNLTNCATTSGNSTITVTSTANLSKGMSVSGAGIPGNCAIFAILSATTFQLGTTGNASQNASATNASVTLTFSNAAIANYVGSLQADEYVSHNHSQNSHAHGIQVYGNAAAINTQVATSADILRGTGSTNGATATNNPSGGNETRMKNANVMAIIKYV